jgi:hypothetical protein
VVHLRSRGGKQRGNWTQAASQSEHEAQKAEVPQNVTGKYRSSEGRGAIDFTDLNKYCPKDDFPLVRFDKITDSATGYEVMALLNYFSGYHQIWLRWEDEEKTSFITPFGTYCYLRMPEGL